ncbi:MAG: hypothetical protein HY351_03930 [Candidatus Omnitrophica bacterium]|nr:hypothetical protein [Candidatus Omnitrophota bacterium]
MIIYQPAAFHSNQDGLSHLAVELINGLVPTGKLLSSRVEADSAHLMLQTTSTLIAFEVYSREVGEEIFETILKLRAFLEAKRKEQNDPTLKDTSIYLLGTDFSHEFLKQVPSRLIGIRLFDWYFIRSGTQEAVMVRELKTEGDCSKRAIDSIQKDPTRNRLQTYSFYQELSTQEFIALSRLGMELRNRRPHEKQIA